MQQHNTRWNHHTKITEAARKNCCCCYTHFCQRWEIAVVHFRSLLNTTRCNFLRFSPFFLQKGNLVLKMKMEPQITDGKRFPKLISNPIQVSTSRWWSSILGHFLMPKKYLWQSHWPIFIFHQKKWLGLHGLFESDDVVVSSQIGTVYILNVPKVWLYIVTQSCY